MVTSPVLAMDAGRTCSKRCFSILDNRTLVLCPKTLRCGCEWAHPAQSDVSNSDRCIKLHSIFWIVCIVLWTIPALPSFARNVWFSAEDLRDWKVAFLNVSRLNSLCVMAMKIPYAGINSNTDQMIWHPRTAARHNAWALQEFTSLRRHCLMTIFPREELQSACPCRKRAIAKYTTVHPSCRMLGTTQWNQHLHAHTSRLKLPVTYENQVCSLQSSITSHSTVRQ